MGIILFFSLIVNHLFASDILLSNIEAKGMSDNSKLLIETNEKGDINRFRLDSIEYFYMLKKTNYISIEQVNSGVSLREQRGVSVIKIKSSNLTSTGGGDIKIYFLKSALNKKYGGKDVDLVREGDDWKLLDSKKVEFNQMVLILRKFLGAPVGIKNILFKKN